MNKLLSKIKLSAEKQEAASLTVEDRRALLRMNIEDRRRILEASSETLTSYYKENDEWKELGAGDFCDGE